MKRINRSVSQQTRYKMSMAKMGSRNPRYGKHLTEKEKSRISESMRRYWASLMPLDN